MAFRFQTNETASDGFRRMAVAQIVRARRHLAHDEDHAVAIHETRKCLKRIRALLRFVRPGLRKEQFRHENGRFRDIARLLSTSRDRQVMRDTVTLLAESADQRQKQAFEALSEVLAKDANSGSGPKEYALDLGPVIAELSRAKKDFKHLRLELDMKDLIRIGLRRSFRTGQKALAAAKANPDSEALHEWRKAVQVHWRHMLLLSEAWPEYFAVRSNTAKELSECLGSDHDLAVLSNLLINGDGSAIGEEHVQSIAALIAARQRDLRDRAFRIGSFLFADDARELADTIERYWSLARDLAWADDKAGSDADATSDSSAEGDGEKTALAG